MRALHLRGIAIAVALVLTPVVAAAQQADAPAEPVSLDAPADISATAVLDAMRKNAAHAFAEAEADIDLARARLDGAQSGLFPTVELSATGKAYETSKKAYRGVDDREVYGTFEVVQPIYDFGQTYGQIKSKRARLAAAQARAREARNTVMMEGLALYYSLHASELKVRALYEAHASAYVSWDKAKERLSIGQKSPIDVAEALADVEKTRFEFYTERAHNNDLRQRLLDLTGLTFGEELVAPPAPPTKKPGDVDQGVLNAFALDHNPDVVVLSHELDALREQRGSTVSAPTLDAFGNVGHSSRDLRGRDEWAVGARLSWPLYDGGVKSAARAELAAQEAKVAAKLDVKKRNLRMAIRRQVVAWENAFQKVIAARARLDYSERRLLQRQRQYEQERVTRLGFAMIDNTFAEESVVAATGHYVMAGAKLVMMLGGDPTVVLEPLFLNKVTGGKALMNVEKFIPKEGSGYGQDDADKVNR